MNNDIKNNLINFELEKLDNRFETRDVILKNSSHKKIQIRRFNLNRKYEKINLVKDITEGKKNLKIGECKQKLKNKSNSKSNLFKDSEKNNKFPSSNYANSNNLLFTNKSNCYYVYYYHV